MKKILVYTLTVAIAATVVAYIGMRMPLPFVQAWWEAGASDYNDPFHKRHRIADGLVLSRSLIRSSRDQIEEWLGPAPNTPYFSDWDLVYPLGAERGIFSIDTEWLAIRLDASGSASEVRILRD
jgi:hypothetical protein